jgi:hypothetical protein
VCFPLLSQAHAILEGLPLPYDLEDKSGGVVVRRGEGIHTDSVLVPSTESTPGMLCNAMHARWVNRTTAGGRREGLVKHAHAYMRTA